MINGLSFTGRETMLTKGTKAAREEAARLASDKVHQYLGTGHLFTKAEVDAAEKVVKSHPY